MPLPLAPVIAALYLGGHLVPHAAGGLIVTAAGGGGYVAGTFLSTTAIVSALTIATASAGGIAAVLTGSATAIWGSAGIFGTTIGATGVKGALMSAGLIASTPLWLPVLAGSAAVGGASGVGYLIYYLNRLKKKGASVIDGQEAQFSEREAKIIQTILLALHKKNALPAN